jgi:ketosteroid isomerase-like protein
MKTTIAALIASLLLASPVLAATPAELTAPIHQFIDGFNTGDTKSAYAAYAPGNITIIDEFAPHIWTGPNGAHAWAAQYDKHAAATGVTDGSVWLGEPTRIEVEGNEAYVICPTVYNYKENGQPTAEEGQMTYVLNKISAGWKIRAWTWSGVKPHPAK